MAVFSRSALGWAWAVLALLFPLILPLTSALVAPGCASTQDPGATDALDAGADGGAIVPPVTGGDGGTTSGDADPGTDTGTAPAPLPILTSMNPDHATAGTAGPPLVVFGAGFVETSVVQVDGAPLPTEFVSDKDMDAFFKRHGVKPRGA